MNILPSDGDVPLETNAHLQLPPNLDLIGPAHKGVSGIYLIWNHVTGTPYIGRATNLHRRKDRHLSELRSSVQKHHNEHLRRAFHKYGENAFSFLVLEEVAARDGLQSAEDRWMRYFGVGADAVTYNIETTSTPGLGRPVSDEAKRKIGEANRGRIKSTDAIDKHRASLSGRKSSEQAKAKQAASLVIRYAREGPAKLEAFRRAIAPFARLEETEWLGAHSRHRVTFLKCGHEGTYVPVDIHRGTRCAKCKGRHISETKRAKSPPREPRVTSLQLRRRQEVTLADGSVYRPCEHCGGQYFVKPYRGCRDCRNDYQRNYRVAEISRNRTTRLARNADRISEFASLLQGRLEFVGGIPTPENWLGVHHAYDSRHSECDHARTLSLVRARISTLCSHKLCGSLRASARKLTETIISPAFSAASSHVAQDGTISSPCLKCGRPRIIGRAGGCQTCTLDRQRVRRNADRTRKAILNMEMLRREVASDVEILDDKWKGTHGVYRVRWKKCGHIVDFRLGNYRKGQGCKCRCGRSTKTHVSRRPRYHRIGDRSR